MYILLLALLTIALLITGTGLWLSPKNTVREALPTNKRISYAGSGRGTQELRGARPAREVYDEYSGYGGAGYRARDAYGARAISVPRTTRDIRPAGGAREMRNVPGARGNQRGSRRHRIGENRHLQARRSAVLMETRVWSDMLASLDIGRLFGQRPGQGTPWVGLMLILLSLFLFGFYSLRTVLPGSSLLFTTLPDTSTAVNTTVNTAKSTNSSVTFSGASKALKRIAQLDVSQYSSQQEHDTWAYSTCSAASMTEVINAYGHNYRIADILKVEADLGEISSDAGLLHPNGIDRTVAKFGFQTRWLHNPSIDDLIDTANSGTPVVINFPPYLWSGGHVLVAIGGNKNYVYLADSSALNMQAMSRDRFSHLWVGFAVVVTPSQT